MELNEIPVSKYITLGEATKSQTAVRMGISNMPEKPELENMIFIGTRIFDPIREHFGVPIAVSSFFRSQALNKAIGGSANSQHRQGKAIDIDADVFGKVTNRQIFEFIYKQLEFDQLIWEFGDEDNPAWVHVSHAIKGVNRKQVLRAVRVDGKASYQNF